VTAKTNWSFILEKCRLILFLSQSNSQTSCNREKKNKRPSRHKILFLPYFEGDITDATFNFFSRKNSENLKDQCGKRFLVKRSSLVLITRFSILSQSYLMDWNLFDMNISNTKQETFNLKSEYCRIKQKNKIIFWALIKIIHLSKN